MPARWQKSSALTYAAPPWSFMLQNGTGVERLLCAVAGAVSCLGPFSLDLSLMLSKLPLAVAKISLAVMSPYPVPGVSPSPANKYFALTAYTIVFYTGLRLDSPTSNGQHLCSALWISTDFCFQPCSGMGPPQFPVGFGKFISC